MARDEAGAGRQGLAQKGLALYQGLGLYFVRQQKRIESFCLGLSLSELHFNEAILVAVGRMNWRVPRCWEISEEAIRTHKEKKMMS